MTAAGAHGPPSRRLAAPLAWLYLRAAALRNMLYDRGVLAVHRAGVPVITVGNLVFGGAGKTSAAIWLTSLLVERGFKVAIVSRGYRGRRLEDPLVVSRGRSLLASHLDAGDEAVLLSRQSAAHVVVVGRRRSEAAVVAEREGADVVVLDDGFQHRSLARDVDIVLVDPETLFGGRRVHLADFLREPPKALLRAHLLLLGMDPSPARFLSIDEAPAPLARLLRGSPAGADVRLAGVLQRPTGVQLPGGEAGPPEWLAGRKVVAVSGIARPSSFASALETLGAIVTAHMAFPDHHPFGAADAEAIARRQRQGGADWVVTTAKDLVRWPAGAPAPVVLNWELTSPAAPAILEFILSRIGPPRASERT